MCDIITEVSSIVTCVAFILYLVGHIIVLIKNKSTVFERFTVIPYTSSFDFEKEDNCLIVDEGGCNFILESDYGIKNVKVYKVAYQENKKGKLKLIEKKPKMSYSNLGQKRLIIRCDIGEIIPTTQFEIDRPDYSIGRFELCESGKNGNIIICNYKSRITLKCLLYHLCV